MDKGALLVALALLAALATLFLPLACARAMEPSDFDGLRMRMTFSGSAQVSGGGFKSLNLTTQRVPQDDGRQSAECSIPTSGGYARFSWPEGEMAPSFSYSCVVSAGRIGVRTDGTEPFPLPSYASGADAAAFLGESERVKLTGEERTLARSLAAGAGGEFEALVRLGKWVNRNVRYDPSYFGKSVPSDRVLLAKAGVCEEFAHLFIALSRSLGIPARYVGGYVWGVGPNRTEGESFGPHGWVEAYFPGEGWVPFDPTFGQWGYVDASHVKLYTAEDSSHPIDRTELSFTGELPPEISWEMAQPVFEILANGTLPAAYVSAISVTATPSEVNAGGYSLVDVSLENGMDIPAAPRLELIYKAGNVPEGSNMALVAESGEPIVAPHGAAHARYVLRAGAAGYAFPVEIMIGKSPAAAGKAEIEVRDGPPKSSVTQEGASLIVKGAPGSYELVGVSDGKTVPFAISPETGMAMVSLAGLSGPVFSTTGNYFEAPEPEDGVLIYLPDVAYEGDALNVTIMAADGARTIEGAAGGQTFYSTTGGRADITLPPASLAAGGEIGFLVRVDGGNETRLSRHVRVIPRPEVDVNLPALLKRGKTELHDIANVSDGRLLSASFSSASGSGSSNGLVLSAAACRKVRVNFSVEYEDLAGRALETSGERTLETECSGVWLVLNWLLDLFRIKL